MELLDRIKKEAQLQKLSLNELNKKAGFGTNIIYSWKTKTPSVNKIESVAKVLDVSVDYLLGMTQDKTRTKYRTSFDTSIEHVLRTVNLSTFSAGQKEELIRAFEYILEPYYDEIDSLRYEINNLNPQNDEYND